MKLLYSFIFLLLSFYFGKAQAPLKCHVNTPLLIVERIQISSSCDYVQVDLRLNNHQSVSFQLWDEEGLIIHEQIDWTLLST